MQRKLDLIFIERKMNKTKHKATKTIRETLKIPARVLMPVNKFLQDKLSKLAKRKETAEKNDPFKDTSRVSDNAAVDTDAAEQFGHARSEAITKHIENRIIQVRKALTRVKIGKYGICEKCGNFIDTKRLRIYPESTICIKCERSKKKR